MMKQSLSNFMKRRAVWQIALVCYWLALFAATHIPISVPRTWGVDWGDKVVHFTAYAVLALLLATAWQLSAGRLTFRHLRWAWIVLAFYGAVDEVTQAFVGRHASIWDWLCDALGALIGLTAFAAATSWIARAHRSFPAEIPPRDGA